MKEKIKFLENEVGNNAEYEKRISAADRKLLKCRTDFEHQEAGRIQLKDEVCQPGRLFCLCVAWCNEHQQEVFPSVKQLLSSALLMSLCSVELSESSEPLKDETSGVVIYVPGVGKGSPGAV